MTRWRSYALYRNRGDGTFEDITDRSGLGGTRDWPTSAALADLDNDGDLDLYVCHYAAWDLDNPKICRDANKNAYLNCSPLVAEALPDHLFRNDGGRFVDVTAEAGIIDHDGRGLGVIAADLDEDGKVDLFVANDSSANFMFRNLGGMRFEEVGHESGVAGNASGAYQSGMGVAAGDVDGDGLIDLCVTNFYGESTTFFRNLGGGMFCDATEAVGLTVATRRLLGFGIALLDVDNDGLLDLASANGHVNDIRPNYPYRMPAQLLRGAARRLTDVSDSAGAPWQILRMGRGLATGDADNDGRQDVLILSHNESLAYLHNRSDCGRFLTIRLQGRASNRDAVGAKVTVVAGGRRRVAYRVGGGSYQSSCDPRLHLGLGTADRVNLIEIVWPSGRVDRHRDLRANTGYLICEGDDSPRPLAWLPERAVSREDRKISPFVHLQPISPGRLPGRLRPPHGDHLGRLAKALVDRRPRSEEFDQLRPNARCVCRLTLQECASRCRVRRGRSMCRMSSRDRRSLSLAPDGPIAGTARRRSRRACRSSAAAGLPFEAKGVQYSVERTRWSRLPQDDATRHGREACSPRSRARSGTLSARERAVWLS